MPVTEEQVSVDSSVGDEDALALVFPDFQDAWILHMSDDLIVVDKPSGVPTQAPSPEEPEDLVSRLKRHLAARTLEPDPYLGVHQRLDRDTSGLVVFARRREANRALASAFEGRQVKKRYLACVSASLGPGDRRELRDLLGQGDDGRMRVLPPRSQGGKLAVTRVARGERSSVRELLQLELTTGRTHQARVQLAHAGAPIAGDVLYGGPAAPRLLLHAAELTLPGSDGAALLTFRAEPPGALRRWLAKGDLGLRIYDDREALDEALAVARERRFSLGRSRRTTAFRLVNEGGDALPGLAVDVYDAFAVVQLYDDGPEGIWSDQARVKRVLDAVFALGFRGVYLKRRPKQANTLVDTRREDLAPRGPILGAEAPDPLVVLEEGIAFEVRLGDGLSTGLFLDQRRNRRLVAATASGARVLNLFAYTCGFSVAAAVGGASSTVSVDASIAALARGRANMVRAGCIGLGEHRFVGEDAFTYLEKAAKKGERYELVVLDPPSYSTSKKRRFVAEQHYGDLAELALSVLAPGGRLLASTNHRGIGRSKLRRLLFGAAEARGLAVAQLKDLPPGADFPPEPGHDPNMKAELLTLAREGPGKRPASWKKNTRQV